MSIGYTLIKLKTKFYVGNQNGKAGSDDVHLKDVDVLVEILNYEQIIRFRSRLREVTYIITKRIKVNQQQ